MRYQILSFVLLGAVLAGPGLARDFTLDLADDGGNFLVTPGTELTI